MLTYDPNNIIGKHMFPELDQAIENWNKLYKEHLDKVDYAFNLFEIYQKLSELTPKQISKFIEKFEEIKGLLK